MARSARRKGPAKTAGPGEIEALMTKLSAFLAAGAILAYCAARLPAMIGAAYGQLPGVQDPTDAGKMVFKRANCMGCHKWHGDGGGGYGGDALSLRKTQLSRDQIIETVSCGRPGTRMPFHSRGAYDAVHCYGMVRDEVGDHIPPEAAGFLRQREIEAVTDYVIANIKGKGEPDLADCVAFFGGVSRVCDVYRKPAPGTADAGAKTEH